MDNAKTANNAPNDPLIITDNKDGKKYYGGDQSWFDKNTRAYAGCGVVAGVNVLRTLMQRDSSIKTDVGEDLKIMKKSDISRDEYTGLMNKMYKKMLVYEIPGINMIYNASKRGSKLFKVFIPSFGMSPDGFIRGVLKFAKDNGILLHSHSIATAFQSYEKGLSFIKEGLEKSGAVVIMTSFNKHPLKLYPKPDDKKNASNTSMKSHFATITEILYNDGGDPVLKLSTWGKMATVTYKELYETWQKRCAYTSTLFYFTRAESDAVYRADRRRAILTLLKCIKQTVLKRA
ncbi:MAG: hypothetical protein K6G22_14775 [Lachnospiraceae bacterium]|nr:hypothetical protein [Lachnospiraceae bacterium]